MKSYSPHLRRIRITAWASFLVVLVGLSGECLPQSPPAENSNDEGIVRRTTSGGVVHLAPGIAAPSKAQPKLTGVIDWQQQAHSYKQVKQFQPTEPIRYDHSPYINSDKAPLIRAANPLNIVSVSETKATIEVVPVKKSDLLPMNSVPQKPIATFRNERSRTETVTPQIAPFNPPYPIFDITRSINVPQSSQPTPGNYTPSGNHSTNEDRRDNSVGATQVQIDHLKAELARMRDESRIRDEALARSAALAREEARARDEARAREELRQKEEALAREEARVKYEARIREETLAVARAQAEAKAQEEARARYEAQLRHEAQAAQARNNAARMQHAPIRVRNELPPLVVRAGAELDGVNVLQQANNPEPLPLDKSIARKEPVSMHLKNADVREALEMLSRSHGINILVAPNVTGTVTVNLENIPVDQAIAGIMKLANLAASYEDDMVFVYAAASLPRKNMRVRVFTLDYVSAKDVLPTVTALISEGGNAFISAIKEDDNRQTKEAVVVADTEHGLERVAEYIEQMDTPPLQVMIEAHVLEVQLGDDYVHGVNLKGLLGPRLELEMTDFAKPMAAPALFARITGGDIDALIEFLQTTGDTKTLASPRVMVLNGQKAKIQVGQQLGFKVTTVTETAAVETVKFLEVGVLLEVTPQITRDGRVMMRVKPEVSSGEINPTTSLPEEDTRELESNVLLMDGQGVVIGGLIQEKDVSTRKKVPWLGDLHIVGKLFQRVELKKSRTEIVITLIPRIIQNDMMATEQDAINVERSMAPIFEGPLRRLPRPWDPSMPDPINNPGPTIPRL